jgi:hypothetical protein
MIIKQIGLLDDIGSMSGRLFLDRWNAHPFLEIEDKLKDVRFLRGFPDIFQP